MINKTKLSIYADYKGDLDMFGRAGSAEEKSLIADLEWCLIDRLLEDSSVLRNGVGSAERNAAAVKNLEEHCEDRDVIEALHKLAKRL